MVEGAAFFLLLHDDVALDPDAVHKLVEESFRSNAGVVSPKFVNWDDPRHPAARRDELRQDAVPSSTASLRARSTTGSTTPCATSSSRPAGASWCGPTSSGAQGFRRRDRGHGGGPRPVVAQPGRGLTRGRCARGAGAPPRSGGGRPRGAGGPDETQGRRPVTMQMLQRRHELRAVLKCYTRFSLVRVLPQAALLALGEVVVAAFARDGERVRAVAGAWRWNARRLAEISLLRGELAEYRLFPDAEVRRLQVRGSARLSRYFSRLSHQGLDAANAVAASRERAGARRRAGRGGRPHRQRRVGLQRGRGLRRARRPGPAGGAGPLRPQGPLGTAEYGTPTRGGHGDRAARDRHGDPRPVLRDPAPRRPVGPASIVGDELAPLLLGLAVGRRGHDGAGLARLRASSGSPARCSSAPWGRCSGSCCSVASRSAAWGVSRFMRPLVSSRARVIAVICYLGLPLPYGALGTGRWDGLVAYAAFPFIARAWPGRPAWRRTGRSAGRNGAAASAGQIAILGAMIAAAASFAPAVVPLTIAMALAWTVGSLLVGARDPGWRVLVVAVRGGGRGPGAGGAVGDRDRRWLARDGGDLRVARQRRRGARTGARSSASPSARRPARPSCGSSWRRPALPLLLGRGIRLAWAARLWVTGVRIVGPRLRRDAGATSDRSRPRSRWSWRRPPSPWPPASASASPPSRTTSAVGSSGGARW